MTTRSGSETRRKTKHIMVRATPEEVDAVKQKARDCGLSAPAYMLACAMGRQTRSKIDAHILNELRRLGGLQKHLFNEGNGMMSREYSAVLVEIQGAISRIASST